MRLPDEVIHLHGGRVEYLSRWVLARAFGCMLSLHKTVRSDDDRALHDHVGWNLSIVLRGGYTEHLAGGGRKWRGPGSIILRRATTLHRLELPVKDGGVRYCWTLWLRGPKVRRWGFQTRWGWVDAEDYEAFMREKEATCSS